MRIGILGSGTLARALGAGWARAGHQVVIGGRSVENSKAAAAAIGARAAPPVEVAQGGDVVLLAVSWLGVEEMLEMAGASKGSLSGATLIDPTNAVDHGVGVLLTESSAAALIGSLAPKAHVVKAFHMFPAGQWVRAERSDEPVTVAMCGDDLESLALTSQLVRDLGATPAVLGGLDRVRQLEEVAGFTIGLAFSGVSPASAVPAISI